MDTEKLATSAVKATISKTSHLKAFIPDEDKEPCWDGEILLYESDDYSKHNIKKISTQVKGKKTRANKIKSTIKYSINNDDLQAYMINGGALYFVVYIDAITGDCIQIYYVALLPMKIQNILKKKTQKTHSVLMKKYPQNTQEQEEIIFGFYSESKRQASFAGMERPSIEDLSKDGVLESISMHVFSKDLSGYNSNTIPMVLPKILEDKSLTLYANIKGGVAAIPIEFYDNIHSVSTIQTINESVGVESVEFYSSYKLIVNAKTKEYHLGTCVIVIIPNVLSEKEGVSTDASLQVKIQGCISDRIKGIEFFRSIVDKESFYLGGSIFKTNDLRVEQNGVIDTFTDDLVRLKKAKGVLDALHVDEDLDLDNCTEEDYKNLNLVIGALGDKLPLKRLTEERLSIQFVRIANLNIAVTYDTINNNHYMFDYFGDAYWLIDKESGKHFPRYWRLTADIILKSSNLNLEAVVKDFKAVDQTDENCTIGNEVMLEMLKAYDAAPNAKLIEAINGMIEWLDSPMSLLNKEIRIINRLQVAKRSRALSFSEKRILFNMVSNTANDQCRISALLLLDEHQEAEKVLNMIGLAERERIQSLPIFKFYKTELS